MKLLKGLLILISFVIANLSGGSISSAETIYYQDWPEKTDVDPHHDWTIKLNQKLEESTVNGNNVYIIQDNLSYVNEVKVIINENKTSITVKAPEEGYKAGGNYLLYIEKGVTSKTGKKLKQSIKMKFTIANGESNSEKVSVPDLELESLINETLYWSIGSSDITKESLLQLKGLNVQGSGIIGITDLSGLEHALNLDGLYLQGNQISDISLLINLKSLNYIDLSGNQIADIRPLISLPNLKNVVLTDNPLNKDALETIKELEERGVSVSY